MPCAIPGFGAGTVAFILTRTDFAPSGNDTLNAWVNPRLGAKLPIPDAISSTRAYGSTIAGLSLVWGDYRSFAFDEVRMGMTAESVMPYTPTP